jgi:hypothetical protein
MTWKLLTIGALGLMLAVSACREPSRNPDDRLLKAGAAEMVVSR